MTAAQLRRQAKEIVDGLSPRRLRAAAEFLAYLRERDSEDATQELLRIPGLVQGVRAAEREIARGRTAPWRQVRRDVG